MAGNSWSNSDGGWDAVYPLSSSSSDDDEAEHDPGTVAYRTVQAIQAFDSRAQRGVGTQPVISASFRIPPTPAEQPSVQNRPLNPPSAAASIPQPYRNRSSQWGNYLAEQGGSRQPRRSSPPPTIAYTTSPYERERYERRTEGRQDALIGAMLFKPTLGQLAQMAANPALPKRVELDMPENLLMDNRRFMRLSNRYPSPRRLAREQLEKEQREEEDKIRLKRMSRHRGPVARMSTGARPERQAKSAPPPTRPADRAIDSWNDVLAEGPVTITAEPVVPRPSSAKQMEVSSDSTSVMEEQTHSEVETPAKWRTLHRPHPSGSTAGKRTRPYDPAEVNLIRLDGKQEPLPTITAHMPSLPKEKVSPQANEMEQEKVADVAEVITLPTEDPSDWEDEKVDDIADQFAHLTVKDRKVRVPHNQGKLGESACGWKPGTDTENLRAWGNMNSSCSCHCPPESIINPAFRSLLTEDELGRVKTHEAHCIAFHRTERNCLKKCNRKLKLQGNDMELYWWPQSGRVATLCDSHVEQLRQHKICPFCREFFAEGNKDFMVCRGASGNETHLYHLDCRAVAKVARMCPHCLESKAYYIEPRYDPTQPPPRRITIRDYRGLFGNLQKTTVKIPRLRSAGGAKFDIYCKKEDKDDYDTVIKAFLDESIHCELRQKDDEALKKGIRELKLWALVEARNSPVKWADTVKSVDTVTGRTLVHIAVEQDSVIKMRLLLLNGADIHLKDKSGETPLMMAVKAKKFTCVLALLEAGADVNTLDGAGYTPLHHAAMQKNYPLMSMFLDFRANASIKVRGPELDYNIVILHIQNYDIPCPGVADYERSVHRNAPRMVFSALEPFLYRMFREPEQLHKSDVNSLAPALFHTLLWIPEACFNCLISRKLDLELQDANGWTFLHWVAFFHRNDLLKYFFETATHWMRDNWGETPLHVAVRNLNVEFVKLFLTRKPILIVEVQNLDGKTPYESACELFRRELDGKKKRKRAEIVRLMERWMDKKQLSRSIGQTAGIFPDRPIGEACGDLSSGKTLAPIPVYNFVNKEFSCHELLYVRHVVAPLLRQTLPRAAKVSKEACKIGHTWTDASGCVTCITETGCRCVSPDAEGRVYNEFVEQCYVPNGQLDPNNRLSRSKPPFSILHRINLKERLLARVQRCSAAIADDLLHILALIDAWTDGCRKGRSGRSRSVEIVRKRTVRKKRSESVARMPGNLYLVRPQETGKLRSTSLPKVARSRGRNPNKFSEKRKNDEGDQYRKFIPNPLDLFDEIHQCEAGAILEGAMIRFERRHEFARWDLSTVDEGAPARHSRGRRVLAGYSKFRVDQLVSYEEYGTESVVALPSRRTKPEVPYRISLDAQDNLSLMECSIYCECDMDCPMRALQWPTIAVRLALFYVDELVGWGVMTLTAIMAGQFLGEYTGELALGNLYGNDTYMYEIMTERNKKKEGAESDAQWSIDAKRAGSITRYVNHSCNPNSKTAIVSAHGMDISRLCLIALCDIPAGGSITLDYGDSFWNAKRGLEVNKDGEEIWNDTPEEDRIFCRCKEPNCKYKKPEPGVSHQARKKLKKTSSKYV